jgi:type II secretory pathway component PulM
VKRAKEAPAANTPLRITSQLGGFSMFHILLYVVWYAFLIDPASKHTSAIKKNTQQIRKSIMPQALEPPGLRALPQQKHRLATIIMT